MLGGDGRLIDLDTLACVFPDVKADHSPLPMILQICLCVGL